MCKKEALAVAVQALLEVSTTEAVPPALPTSSALVPRLVVMPCVTVNWRLSSVMCAVRAAPVVFTVTVYGNVPDPVVEPELTLSHEASDRGLHVHPAGLAVTLIEPVCAAGPIVSGESE
jgi:hypothetical protein